MASIIKRKKNYSIVYTYVDENGETKQKWETRSSYQDALKRKAEVENQKTSRSFLPPSNQSISEFIWDFAFLYRCQYFFCCCPRGGGGQAGKNIV